MREALALFRGEPLADLQLEPWAQGEIARLEERRLAALEARVDADLALGRERELVPELEELVAEQPFREHLLEQLVLALYRSWTAGGRARRVPAGRDSVARRARARAGPSAAGAGKAASCDRIRHSTRHARRLVDHAEVRRRRGWKLVLAGAALVLAAASAAAVVIATRSSAASLASVPPGVAIVDASSGHLVAQIPPSQIEWPAEVITGDGSFWVWSIYPFAMVRIDPSDGRILARISSPFGGDAAGYLVEGRSLWFSGKRLVRMDIAQQREVDRFAVSKDPRDDGLAQIARGDGSLWIARQQAGELLRVDPANGHVQHRFRNLPFAFYVAYGDGALWVASAHGVSLIDPKTNTITATAPVPQPIGGTNLAVGGGYGWASDETKGTVYKIDRSGQIVSTYETGDGARHDVVLGRDAMGRQPGRWHRHRHRRCDRRRAHVPLRPPAPDRRGAARKAARLDPAGAAPSRTGSTHSRGRWRA